MSCVLSHVLNKIQIRLCRTESTGAMGLGNAEVLVLGRHLVLATPGVVWGPAMLTLITFSSLSEKLQIFKIS